MKLIADNPESIRFIVFCICFGFEFWNLRFIWNLVLVIWDLTHFILDMNVQINFVNYIWDKPLIMSIRKWDLLVQRGSLYGSDRYAGCVLGIR